MWSDVVDLEAFYASRLGETAGGVLRGLLRRTWPEVEGQTIAGYGYPLPFLEAWTGQARSLVALMPAPQGVVGWPSEGPNRSCLVEEEHLPLADLSLDRLLLVHALEHAERPAALLREAWRVLQAEGRLLIVVPNRRGLWARLDRTPFGWGRPFSRVQVERLLSDMLFEEVSAQRSLYLPPSERAWMQRTAGAWEKVGQRCYPRFGGVIVIEARKRVLGLIGGTPARARAVRVLPGLAARPSTAAAETALEKRRDAPTDA
ncbi:MAG: methyltransferase domain-containing protein [Pseudomonadota bacterium]